MSRENVLAYRYYVNEKSQVEGVELVEDKINPDGVYIQKSYRVTSMRISGGVMSSGNHQRMPDIKVPVRIRPTGNILLEEAGLEAVNHIVDQWDDYGPLEKKK